LISNPARKKRKQSPIPERPLITESVWAQLKREGPIRIPRRISIRIEGIRNLHSSSALMGARTAMNAITMSEIAVDVDIVQSVGLDEARVLTQ
jgi:hypothetical protein